MRVEDTFYISLYGRYMFLTFATSWLIWSVLILYPPANYFVEFWIGVLGLFGPSLAGLYLSYKYHGTWWQHYLPRPLIFFPVFVISSFIGIVYMYRLTQISSVFANLITIPVILLILFCSLLSSYFFTLMVNPPPGFETRNDSPLQIRTQVSMLLFALLVPIIIGLLSLGFRLQFNIDEMTSYLVINIKDTFILPVYLILFTFLFGGPTNEEIGWRGYLTPKMLQRINPMITGIIIGFFWSFWHLPLHLANFYGDGINGIWFRFMWNIPVGVVFTWYYIKSGYNLLGAIILHSTFNLFSFIGDVYIIPAYTLTAAVMIIESKMWQSPYLADNTLSSSV